MQEYRRLHRYIQDVVVKPAGKTLFGRPRRRCEDNVKMDLQEVGVGFWNVTIWLRLGRASGHL
jgi:hypothetical protein